MSWVSLHTRSQFSILESTSSVSALCHQASKYGMPALALTDVNLYGAIDFVKACKAVHIQPILGCTLFMAPVSRHEKKKIGNLPNGFPLVLLAKNRKGYQNLCKLSSIGYTEGFYYIPRIDKEVLQLYHEGLICLSGPLFSKLSFCIVSDLKEELAEEIAWLKGLFKDDLYFELQRHAMSQESLIQDGIIKESWLYQKYIDHIQRQEKVNQTFIELSKSHGIECVATHESYYLEREDWRAHEIFMNIQSGEPCEVWEKDPFGQPKEKVANPKRKVLPSHEMYFKSPQEMCRLFADLPEALQMSVRIAEKCRLELDFSTKFYPIFVPPKLEKVKYDEKTRLKEAESYLGFLCEQGIAKRYTPERLEKIKEKYPDKNPLDVVYERLKYELGLIKQMGMCDYLLIVYDFIAWAKKRQIPVGPGRGSGAGSIILYLIEITDIEPLRFNLFFERFINPERISYPDIDVDICMERRNEVIDYTVNKYGKDKVAQIITFGSMKAKMVIKDVGRILSVPLPKVNTITKLIPEELNITLEKALEIDVQLKEMYDSDEETKQLIDMAKKLEGSLRNTGVHAAGLIICGDPLTDHIPICTSKDSDLVLTQYSMKPVESVGMLKIDFLGLKTLTCIQKATQALKETRNITVDWVNLPLDDQVTFDLLNQGKTEGIFQLESLGMRDLVMQLRIDRFEEVIAVNALYRPGPMEMIPSFINRKHQREEIEQEHPLIEDILSETYGIMVYQEQVMQIASRLAKFTLAQGDVLRRAMGKKDKEEMAKQRQKFLEGAVQNGVELEVAGKVFDKIEKFASYGFNKSHAAAYAYLSYVTAYFKANFPKEWMAALMTCDIDDITKVAKHIQECQVMHIAILPPHLNESGQEFVATSQGIRFAMSAIKGVGTGIVDAIIQERKKGGAYTSLIDFFKRLGTKKVGKKVTEVLVDAGCFDFLGVSRATLRCNISPLFEKATREQMEMEQGVMDFFSKLDKNQELPLAGVPDSRQELLKREKELLGFYLTGHPMDEYRDQLSKLSCVPLFKLEELAHQTAVRVACIIETVRVRISTKNQKKFAIITISDGITSFELPIWSNVYEEKSALVQENQLIYAVLQVEKEQDQTKLRCQWFDDLTALNDQMIKACDDAYEKAQHQKGVQMKKKNQDVKDSERLTLSIDLEKMRLSHIIEFKKLFTSHRGETPVEFEFVSCGKKMGRLELSSSVSCKQELVDLLNQFACISCHQLR